MSQRVNHKRGIQALFMVLALCLAMGVRPAFADGAKPTVRLGGDNRYATMSAILDEVARSGAYSGQSAVVTTGQNYPDALSATALAGLFGPIILTGGNNLSADARAQLKQFGATQAVVVGGEGAVSGTVLTELGQMGVNTFRIAGSNRQGTSLACATNTTQSDQSPSNAVILATGRNFADALSIGPWAVATQTPVLLVGNDGLLTADEVSYIRGNAAIKYVVILGGAAVVSDGVKNQLGSAYEYLRLSGADRYETSAQIAEFEAANGFGWTAPAITTGADFADALSGATLACAYSSPILLVKGSSGPTVDCLKRHASEVSKLYVLGGERAVPSGVANAIAASLGTSNAGAVSALTTSTFDSAIAQSDKLVVVDFWADWCGPCKRYSPIVQEVARDLSDRIQVYTVDIDENRTLSSRYSITNIPCLVLFRNGREVGRLVGARDKSALISALNPYL